jgi:hypothetical protein
VPELTSQSELEDICLKKTGVCVISFFAYEPEFPESVKIQEDNLAILAQVKQKFYDLDAPFQFVWVNHIAHGRKLSKDFDLRWVYKKVRFRCIRGLLDNSDMLPGLLAVNGNKKVYQPLRTAFDVDSISSFLKDMMAGRGRNFQYSFNPLLDAPPKPKKKKEEDEKRDEL